MRIALVSPYSWTVPGGVNDHVANLAGQLEDRGHEPWIIAPAGTPTHPPDEERLPRRFISAGTALPFRSNGSKAYLNLWPLMIQRMEKILEEQDFDLIHAHEPCAPSAAALVLGADRAPVVGTFHAAGGSGLGYRMLFPLAGRVIDKLTVRIAVSEAARAYVGEMFPGEYRVVPNGVDVRTYAPARSLPKAPGQLLFIGRPEPRKGLFILLQAFALVRERFPGASLALVGTREAELRTATGKMVPKLDYPPPGVSALGRLSLAEKIDAMGRAELLVVPSLKGESFGIVLVEGLAAGLPVVASDIPAYRSVLLEGEAGRLTPPGDPFHLADELVALLGDRAARARLARKGLAAVGRYDWPVVAGRVAEVYEDAVDRWTFAALGRQPSPAGRNDSPRSSRRR